MNPGRAEFDIPASTFYALSEHLRLSGSTLTVTEALALAVQQWIAADQAGAIPVRGYQWKELFLPATTKLRMLHDEQYFYAEVVDDALIFQNQSRSPHQMAQAIAGDGRNAWRDLWLRLPGERSWINAAILRNKSRQQAAIQPPSPMEAMQAAAKSMSSALQSALLLVEHAQQQGQQHYERRIPKHRRRADFMADDCESD